MSDSIGDREHHGRKLPDSVQRAIDLGERRQRRADEKAKGKRFVGGTLRPYEVTLRLRFESTSDESAIDFARYVKTGMFADLSSCDDVAFWLKGPDGPIDTAAKGSP